VKKRYSPLSQRETVQRWLLGVGGRRPSEAAMEVTSFTSKKLRSMHREVKLLLEDGKLEETFRDGRWVIIDKENR
jgi:hypothetical protein